MNNNNWPIQDKAVMIDREYLSAVRAYQYRVYTRDARTNQEMVAFSFTVFHDGLVAVAPVIRVASGSVIISADDMARKVNEEYIGE